MKRKQHKMRQAVVSAVLAFSLAFSMTVPAFAAPSAEEKAAAEAEAAQKTAELIAAAEELQVYVAANYEGWYEDGFDYAKAGGYIDKSIEGIDAAIAVLNGIDYDAFEATAEVEADLKAAVDAAVVALEALKNALPDATGNVAEDLALAQTLADEALAALNAALALAEQANVDYVIPALNEAYGYLVDVVIPQLQALAEAAAEWLAEQVELAYAAFLAALPEIDAALYDWFYNNPDKVCGFFAEYGDEFCNLLEQNSEAVLAVLGFIAKEFGPEAIEYVLENPKDTLFAFVDWFEKYGERVWNMLDVYFEYLGVYDAIEAQIAALEAELADLKAQLEAATGELKAQIEEQIALVEAEIAKLVEAAGSVEEFCQQVIETLSALYAEAKALTEAAIVDATHGEWAFGNGSEYVALGDATIAGENTYADQLAAVVAALAEEAGVEVTYDKAAVVDEADLAATTADILAAVQAGELDEALADADLVTVSAGAEDLTVSIVYQLVEILSAYATDEAAAGTDWIFLVGPEAAGAVAQSLEVLEAELAKQIDDEAIAALAVDMIEAVAYGYAGFAVNYVELLNAVQAAAPNAHVVAVGLANALEGLTFDINGFELAIGEYAGWVVKAADLELLAYAALDEGANVTFVSAPAASCDAATVIAELVEAALAIDFQNDPEAVLELLPFVSQLAEAATWMPNEAGQAYIAEQILGAVSIAAVADAVYTAEPAAPAVAGAATAASEAVEVTDEAVAAVTFEDGCVAEATFAIGHLATVESFEDFGEPADGHWYLEEGQGSFAELRTLYMDYALATGIMSGYVNREDGTITHFGPWDSLDRAQAATVIYRMANADITATTDPAKYADNATAMADVEDGEYYTAAVNWCVDNGIITGYEAGPKAGSFGPYDKVTREQLAAMIQRYCVNVCGAEMLYGDITAYDDYDEINGEWAVPGLQFCKAYGIMTGIYGTNDLNPAGNANRAEAAKMFSVVGHDIL